jgi:hypothetical protein
MGKISLLALCIVFICMSFSIQSCCKQACPGNEMDLLFINFTRQEVDTLLLVKYEPGNAFTNKVDSLYVDLWTSSRNSKDTLYGHLDNIDFKKDYEIILPALNRTFRISDLKTTRERCPCSGGHYHAIWAYRSPQGNFVNSRYVELTK